MLELQVVDAFADRPFSGNPAAVTVLDRFPADEWMQKVAREMNLSETAFVVARPDGGYDLRWMTPLAEVDLCGHATLATAHVLGGAARFHTRSGQLDCGPGPDGLIEMSFPADPPTPVAAPLDLPGTVAAARGRTDYLIEVGDESWLREWIPDMGPIAALDARTLIVTAAGHGGVDFVSRVFAPAVGIPEDPVTGSAHCTLARYWSARTGRTSMTGYQASARGGTVHVRIAGDRVVVGGRAVTVSEVRMHVEVPD
ncbi:MAG TPA: PhzF family phenazine biosynthesis protein [Acidimicrobiales bacterium]|jgi:predicted PhzF superfamily epimerase YddE/YHI9|nr:PhzF family phenazine biosynthesis protein [Acidimicrobiales bacterium]